MFYEAVSLFVFHEAVSRPADGAESADGERESVASYNTRTFVMLSSEHGAAVDIGPVAKGDNYLDIYMIARI